MPRQQGKEKKKKGRGEEARPNGLAAPASKARGRKKFPESVRKKKRREDALSLPMVRGGKKGKRKERGQRDRVHPDFHRAVRQAWGRERKKEKKGGNNILDSKTGPSKFPAYAEGGKREKKKVRSTLPLTLSFPASWGKGRRLKRGAKRQWTRPMISVNRPGRKKRRRKEGKPRGQIAVPLRGKKRKRKSQGGRV